MKRLFIFMGWIGALPLFCLAQPLQAGKLLLKEIPAGWSRQVSAQQIILSNYNAAKSEYLSLYFFPGTVFEGKPEQTFQIAWRQWVNATDTTPVPRPRRMFTADGLPVWMGGMETKGPNGKAYYYLTIYLSEKEMAPVLMECGTQKIFKLNYQDWINKLLEMVWVKPRP